MRIQFTKTMSILYLILLMASQGMADTTHDKHTVSQQNEVTFVEAIKEISVKFDVFFTFDLKLVEGIMVDEAFRELNTVESAVEYVLQNTSLKYRIIDTQYVIIYKNDLEGLESLREMSRHIDGLISEGELEREMLSNRKADIVAKLPSRLQLKNFEHIAISVEGTVVDEQGESLIGVNIQVKGSNKGTATDFEGYFTLADIDENAVLIVSYVGYQTQEVPVSGKSVLTIILKPDSQLLEEVVVVGYGQQKKISVTGSLSTVSNRELVQTPVANISNSLTGRATGILAMQRSGEPGEDQSRIRIRGISTYSGSQEPLVLVDGIESDNYNNIDPNEIEQITILKDASSTAVYGVRGANGVIIITTKRGLNEKPTISFSSNGAVTSFLEYPERLNSYNWARTYNEALKYDSYISGSYSPFFSEEEIELYRNQTDPIFHADTDWPEFMFKDQSLQQQHNLNIRGGTNKVKYFASIGYLNQLGHFKNTHLVKDFFDQQIRYNRYNFRTNFDFEITKRLSLAINLSSQIDNKRSFAGNANSFIREIAINSPLGSPGIVDGKLIEVPSARTQNNNLLAILNRSHIRNYKNYLNGSIELDYALDFILDGLSTHATFSYRNLNIHNMNFNKPIEIYDAIKDANGGTVFISNQADGVYNTGQGYGKRRQNYFEIGVDYGKSFGNHNVTGLLLYNQTKRYDPNLQYIIPSGYQGIVGRVTYDYKNKYLLEYNAGYNGTENFAPGKQFGYFPAYSAGWVLSEEEFFPDNNLITFLKFRGSYGEVGNDKIGGDRFLYTPTSYFFLSNRYHFGYYGSNITQWEGAYEGKIGNPNLTWERSKKLNIGFEINLFDNKLSIKADKFNEKRDNILSLPQTIPDISGMDRNIPALNLGKVDNAGYDGEISFRSAIGSNFNYWVRATYTYARNVLIYNDEVANPYSYLEKTGQTIGQIYGLVDDGLYNSWEEVSDAYRPISDFSSNLLQPGDIRWKDINGDGIVDDFDEAAIGYSQFPEKVFGLAFEGDISGFDFSLLFQGAENFTYRGQLNVIMPHYNNYASAAYLSESSWTQERYENGSEILHPRIFHGASVSNNNYKGGTYHYIDASYVRLKNAEIGYSLKNQILSRIGMKTVRFYVNGSNLLTWTKEMGEKFPGVDPEDYSINNSGLAQNTEPYPRVRVINFGVNIQF